MSGTMFGVYSIWENVWLAILLKLRRGFCRAILAARVGEKSLDNVIQGKNAHLRYESD
jgi:hypothetical protein